MTEHIEIKVFAKLILFGEWAVLEGFPGVGITLNKSFNVTAHPRLESELLLSSENHEYLLKDYSQFDWKNSYFNFFIQGLKSSQSTLPSQHVSFMRNWKSAEGLGSSSAALLAGALLGTQKLPTNSFEHWTKLLPLLQECQGGKGSGFDLALQIFGNALCFENKIPTQTFDLELPKQLVLLHSGKKWITSQKLSQTKVSVEFCRTMGKITENFIAKKDWINSLNESQKLLNREGFIPSDLMQSMRSLESMGKIQGWKSTGAGGGDAVLCWSDDPEKLLTESSKVGFWSTYPLVQGGPPEIRSRVL